MTLTPPRISSLPSPLLDGSWEHSGRSLNSAALLGLLGIGVLYFNGQSILALIAVAITKLAAGSQAFSGRSFDDLLKGFRQFVGPLRVVVFVTQILLMLVPSVILVRRWHSSAVWQYIRLNRAPVTHVLLAVLTTLAFIPAGNFVAQEFIRQLDIPPRLMALNAEFFSSHSLGEFLWLVILVSLTPALCEEVFFRGLIQRTFERTMDWKSVILVGCVFGLFHFNPLGLFTLSVLGMLFGYFFYRSKSLLPSMAAHGTNNFVAIVFLFQGPGNDALRSDSIPIWLVAATLPVAIALLFMFHRQTKALVRDER